MLPQRKTNAIMNENKQIRYAAWDLLWNGKWMWKMLSAYLLLQIASQSIVTIFKLMITRMGICNIGSMLSNDGFDALCIDAVPELTASTCFILFISLIMSGILCYGNARIQNRAADGNPENLLKAAFGGFNLPLELAWLSLRLLAVYVFYLAVPAIALLFAGVCFPVQNCSASLVASCVAGFLFLSAVFFLLPFYKYRYVFRIKADNPDWGAGKCMNFCRVLTSGEKLRIFKHDCSYWKIFLLPVAGGIAVMSISLAVISENVEMPFADVSVPALYFLTVFSWFVAYFCNGVGQSLLYRKISSEKTLSSTME